MSTEPDTQVDTAAPGPSAGQTQAEIDEWIRARAARAAIGPIAGITAVHQTPWSTVLAVAAGTKRLYFKAVWPPQRHEASATALLAWRSPHHVPPVVAVDADRGWMLLEDGGEPLKRRDAAGQLALLPQAVRQYAELQVAWASRIGDLLSAGVPDRRDLGPHLDRLIAGYPSEREDTLTEAELVGLGELARELPSIERRLAAVQPASIDHGDLHCGNILVDTGNCTRVFDWGDVSVASPFLSLATLLESLEESLALAAGDASLDRIVDEYLAPFGTLSGPSDVGALVREARVLGSVSRAVTWNHIATHVPPEDRAAFPDPVASSLRDGLRLLAR